MKTRLVLILAVALLTAAIGLAGCSGLPAGPQVSLSQAIKLSASHNLKNATLDANGGLLLMTAAVGSGQAVTVTDVNGKVVNVADGETLFAAVDGMDFANLQTLGFVLPPDYSTTAVSNSSSIWLFVIPLLLFAGIIFLFMRSGRSAQNQTQGIARSRARLVTGNRPGVKFADVAGADEAKEDLHEVVEFLRNRWKFTAIGATIPKGVLLVGPPGTGKTLLARAVAGEAGVPFFSVSGSEFVEIFVGVGAARVRDLFEQAKHSAPCIIFMDEIDAVGRQRSGGLPGGHEEREQTLNQILVEMDGFDPNIGVVVLAATNRPDTLDPALLRPGRFDRRVTLDLPDTNGRKAILQIHAKAKKLAPEVDLDTIAKETHGFSGADLANLVNEAAILAVRHSKPAIGMTELDDAIDRVIAGPERKSLRVNPKDKETTAFHEAGHALVAHLLPNVDPVHKISIVARGSMGGYTRLATEDRYFITKSQCKETLATLLAGHASEEMVFAEVSTGPHSDIKQATALATKMVTDYGMSEKLGARTYGAEAGAGYYGQMPVRDYSEEVARQIDEEVKSLLDEARGVAKRILEENRARLNYISQQLLAEETLDGEKLEQAFTAPLPPAGQPSPAAASPPQTSSAGSGTPAPVAAAELINKAPGG